MNSTQTNAVGVYLAEVRSELSDLPPGELEDVLDDVTDHLAEVAAELADSTSAQALEDRLGTPRQYADELRTAAGYPPKGPPTAAETAGASAALRWGVVAATVGPFFVVLGILDGTVDSFLVCFFGLAVSAGAAALGLRALRDKDPRAVLETPRGKDAATTIRGILDQLTPGQRHELRTVGQPVWWVARGMAIGGGIFGVFGAGAAAVVAAVAGAVLSVWVGRRTQENRRWLWYVVPLNVVAAIVVPVWLVASFVGVSQFANGSYDNRSSDSVSAGLAIDGQPITNIYPFDAAGRPVKVRLYDQSGQPINLPVQNCAATWDPDANGSGLTNLFPQPVVVQDGDDYPDNSCQESDEPPFVAPPMPAIPTSSAPPTPGLATPQPTRSLTTPSLTTRGPSPSAGPSAGPGVNPSTVPTSPGLKPGTTLTVVPNR